MFIDTHCHLDFEVFDSTRDELINNCLNLGISDFINPATQSSSWDKLLQISNQFSNIHICFGLHPIFITNHSLADISKLEEYTQFIDTKLIGEIGLDKRVVDFDKQLSIFSNQISVAQNLDKKVIIHSVKSHNEIIKTLKDSKFTNGGIIHAFNGNADIAQTYIDMGFKLGIGGLISHPTSKLPKTLATIAPSNIVLETDSPDMRLYGSDKNINTPASIPQIFELLCDIYQLNPAILKQQIYNSSLEFI